MGQHHPNLLFPGTGAEMSQSAHSRCHSWTQPRCPLESCSRIGDRSQESQGSRTLLALNAHKNSWVYKGMEETAACVTWLCCHITCAVFAISSVWVDTGAGVGAFCVLTAGVIVTVRAQSTLIHICTHIWLKTHTKEGKWVICYVVSQPKQDFFI